VCFVGDDALPGAVAERAVLRTHAASGDIDLIEPTDLIQMAELMAQGGERFDVLVLAVHGSGEGFGYAFEHKGHRVAVHELAEWRLPSIVVAASCSSGRRGTRLNLPTVLANSVPALVVGLWDLDDAAVGALLGRFYAGLFETRSLTAAWTRLAGRSARSGLRLLAGDRR
jgi:hypothetical protein